MQRAFYARSTFKVTKAGESFFCGHKILKLKIFFILSQLLAFVIKPLCWLIFPLYGLFSRKVSLEESAWSEWFHARNLMIFSKPALDGTLRPVIGAHLISLGTRCYTLDWD